MWEEIVTAPANEIVLVCNPKEGNIPVIAKRIGQQWHNIGAIVVGYRAGQTPYLKPSPTHWMRWPSMPQAADSDTLPDFKAGDRVEHMNGTTGLVSDVKDGAVFVTFDGGKDWRGRYDAGWFQQWPEGLRKLEQVNAP